MEADAPKKISRYDVVDLVGRGRMGVVYKAMDHEIGRLVAIEIVIGAEADQGELLQRFYRQAQFIANLRHVNIVTIYDVGDFEGRPFLVMEYLDGQSLELLQATTTIPMLQKVSYARQICSALEYAHSRQPSVIHGDIKPANIVVLEAGRLKIVDFGVARLVDSRHSRDGHLMGSPYMSPEQIQGMEPDGRSDIFSTGLVLYQLLTLKLPFQSIGGAPTPNRIFASPAPPLSQFIQGYPAALDHIVGRALAKQPEERYPSASEFCSDLLEVEEQLKRSLFRECISRAERLVRGGQLVQAKQELLNVLEIDRHQARANELMRQVVQAIATKQVQERARDLRAQAEQALEQKRFAEALGCLEEAMRIDNPNRELQALRHQVIGARIRTLNEVLSHAERAYSAGDLEGASRAVDEAFELDPEAARAKSLNAQIALKVAERERERRAQDLLGLARRYISARKFGEALEAVKKAESLNPAAAGIRDVMALLASVQEHGQRRKGVEKAAAEIIAALDRSDPSLACRLAQAAVQQFPNEGTLLQWKARAEQLERQARVAEPAVRDHDQAHGGRRETLNEVLTRAERAYSAGDLEGASRLVDEAFELDPEAARAKSLNAQIAHKVAECERERRTQELLEVARRHISARKFGEALEAVNKAESLNPAASGIRDVRALVASGQEQEQRRRAAENAAKVRAEQLERQAWVAEQETRARGLLEAGKNAEALAAVEAALRRCPGQSELDSLLALVRAAIQREESERRSAQITAKAKDALKRKNYDEAIQLLEAAKSEMKSGYFDELLRLAREEETRFQWEQKVSAAAAQALRFIERGEHAKAADFLDSAARELSSEDLRVLAARARRQWEDYRQQLDELIAKANRLLAEGKGAEAAACLKLKADIYGREPSFQLASEQARQQQQKADAIIQAAIAVRAQLSSGNGNEARRQLARALHDFGDVRELRELEAGIDRQQAKAIHNKMEAALGRVEDLIRLRAGAQALAALQSIDDLVDKVPPGLRKRHDELKTAVDTLLKKVKEEPMPRAAAPDLLKPELSIPGSRKSELKKPGESRPGPSDGATTVLVGSGPRSGDWRAESNDPSVMELTPPTGIAAQESTPAEGIVAGLGPTSPSHEMPPETMRLEIVPPLGSLPDKTHSVQAAESKEGLGGLPRSNSSAQFPDLPKSNPAISDATTENTSGWEEDVLRKVEQQLAAFLGPFFAGILVKKASSRTTDPEELYSLLAANLKQEDDRRAFLARKTEITHRRKR